MVQRIITIFTSTRAEFGILKPLIRAIDNDPLLTMKLVVGGTHLSTQHGYTKNEIIAEGFAIDAEIDFIVEQDGETLLPDTLAKSIALSSHYLQTSPSDIAVILGDRFEALGFGLACYTNGIPIAHIHGGELTIGALDDAFRHSLTKLSSLHFAASERYRERIIQLGEQPSSVFNTGPLCADNMVNSISHTKESLLAHYDIKTNLKHVGFLSIHPETTLSSDENRALVQTTLSALDYFKDVFLFVSAANNDPDGGMINELLNAYKRVNHERVFLQSSFGQVMFYNCLWNANFIIGNSSSAIIEAPILQVPSINIGKRQDGRFFAETVCTVAPSIKEIKNAISDILQNATSRPSGMMLKEKARMMMNEKVSAAEMIVSALKTYRLEVSKTFYDFEV